MGYLAKLRIYKTIAVSIQTISLFLNAVKTKKHFDIILCGGGASSLLLANAISKDPYFNDLQIAIIEKEEKKENDRTWCFWEKGESQWDDILFKSWNSSMFKAKKFHKEFALDPYEYKMIRAADFYQSMQTKLRAKKSFHFIQEEIIQLHSLDAYCEVETTQEVYQSQKVFSSLPVKNHLNQKEFPVLQQHFIGWFVKTENDCFDPSRLTFMDFDLEQKNSTRFMYVLPFSKKEALLEYTLFSENLLQKEEYEEAIKVYLDQKNVSKYTIIEKEKGSIPMTAYDFTQHNSPYLMHIGTAGGWTKASTGFTFKKSERKVHKLIAFLKKEQPLNQFKQQTRFNFYDKLFLDVLAKYNGDGSQLLTQMFRSNSPKRILQFLDEQSSWWQEVMLMISFPIGRFVKALINRLL